MNYYVVLGIAEDADEEDDPERLSSVGEQLPRMVALAPRLGNSGALAKHMRRSPIPNAVAGVTSNCKRLVRVTSPLSATRSSFFDELVEELSRLAMKARSVPRGAGNTDQPLVGPQTRLNEPRQAQI